MRQNFDARDQGGRVPACWAEYCASKRSTLRRIAAPAKHRCHCCQHHRHWDHLGHVQLKNQTSSICLLLFKWPCLHLDICAVHLRQIDVPVACECSGWSTRSLSWSWPEPAHDSHGTKPLYNGLNCQCPISIVARVEIQIHKYTTHYTPDSTARVQWPLLYGSTAPYTSRLA